MWWVVFSMQREVKPFEPLSGFVARQNGHWAPSGTGLVARRCIGITALISGRPLLVRSPRQDAGGPRSAASEPTSKQPMAHGAPPIKDRAGEKLSGRQAPTG